MKIKKVAILGLGLIGGSIAKALKKTNYNIEISAYDNESILKIAEQDGSINVCLNNPLNALQSDIIFLSLPVELSLKYFIELVPQLSEKQIITDVCSVKSIFTKQWETLSSKGYYIGGHPMTGKEKGGYKNADPLLFENSVYILEKTPGEHPLYQDFLSLITSLGARITLLDPYLHDKIVANVSHLPQILSISLVNSTSIKNQEISFLDFAAGGFRDMTRIASSDFQIWESVIKHNRKEILTALDLYLEEISIIKNLLEEENNEVLAEKFEDARIKRDEIPKTNKGFISSLHDIYVFVKDEPGVISKISTALYNHGINIKDIELLKIREGTGGTFRLSFDNYNDSKEAILILNKIGFETN
ncbi:prephenate dehydrogenase/arogenate dehydrogenase family protein [Bacteroidota bacterium]